MKPLGYKLQLYKSKQFKNLSILFGIFLSTAIISSFQLEESFFADYKSQESDIQINQAQASKSEMVEQKVQDEKNSTKYHNFLASYFLQESSKARKSKRTEEKGQVISNLRDFRNVIVSRSLSLF